MTQSSKTPLSRQSSKLFNWRYFYGMIIVITFPLLVDIVECACPFTNNRRALSVRQIANPKVKH